MRVVIALVAAGTLLTATDLTPQKAEVFRQKMLAIRLHSEAGTAPGRRTIMPEDEVNSYFRFRGPEVLPSGIADPRVTLLGASRVVGRATVDLDAVRQTRGTGGWFDPLSYLSGRLPVVVTGTLRGERGAAHFTLEQAEVSGVSVPKSLLQELVSYYTRSPDAPRGLDLDAPFDMPSGIDRLVVEPGRAILVQ
ncbi:MAG: hypothetical protein IT307_07165 [Chloroflexi bacterium]|nr:hypothetical protein [Chloroflexota bacterium]